MTARQPHIAYVLKRFPRISETFVANELIELRRQGARVSVLALARPPEAFTHRFLDDLDVEVTYLARRPSRRPVRTTRALAAAAAARPGALLAEAARAGAPPTPSRARRLVQGAMLADALRAADVDHVHAHFASTAAKVAHLSWRLGGPGYSVTAHAKDIYHQDVTAASLRRVLGAARFVATVSEDNVRHLRGVLDGRGDVRLVRNAVDLRRVAGVSRAPEPGLVLVVARLVEKKGLPDLVRACGVLRRAGEPVRLEVIGDGPLRSELVALADREGVEATFRGALDNDEVIAAFGRAAVFALPCVVASTGDRDGLPTVVLEAMAAAVPVVTTDVNGLSDAVVDGRTGLVVGQHDPRGLADALRRVLTDPVLGRRLGEAGRDHVRGTFALHDSVRLLHDLFLQHAGHDVRAVAA